MPYFNNENVNLLLIHIPKTGGSSLELYFSHIYKIPLNNKSLHDFLPQEQSKNININSSLQHLIYQQIINNKDFFKINPTNMKIISVVRSPYTRLVSDLFFLKKINIDSTKEEVYEKIKIYLREDNDNHNLPQYLFVTDENKKLINNIKIMYTESLTKDMIRHGYNDFNLHVNDNKNKINYFNYLNPESIALINEFYDDDFKIFLYKKK